MTEEPNQDATPETPSELATRLATVTAERDAYKRLYVEPLELCDTVAELRAVLLPA